MSNGGLREAGGRPRRAYELDLLRLVAALGVVAYHLTWHAQAVERTSPVRFPAAVTGVTRYGFLGVELFFLISGMVILASATGRTPRQFAASRISRLYPAYWTLVTVTFVVTHLAGAHRLTVGFGDYLVNLTMLQELLPRHVHRAALVDGVYWTLTIELVFYAIVWATLLVRQLHRIVGVLALWLALAAVAEVARVGPTGSMRRYLAVQYAPFFVVGACCALVGTDRRRWAAWGLLALAAPFAVRQSVVVVRDLHDTMPAFHPWVGAAVTAAAIAVVLAVALGALAWAGRPWMLTAGLLTYPLYLVHQNVGIVLLQHLDGLDRWVALAIAVAVVVGIAWATQVLVERPLGPRLRAGLDRRSRPAASPPTVAPSLP